MESTNDDVLALTRQALAVLDQVDTTCLPPYALASLQAQKLSLRAQMAGLQAQRDFIAQTSLLLMGFSAATQTQTQSPERIHDRAQSQAHPPRLEDTLPDADEAKEAEISPANIPIFLKGPCLAETLVLDVEQEMLVADFRRLVQDKTHIPSANFRLVFGSQVLWDGWTLSRFGITKDSTVDIRPMC